jgi:hypothetical protein
VDRFQHTRFFNGLAPNATSFDTTKQRFLQAELEFTIDSLVLEFATNNGMVAGER